jgi:predicted site-specific integrase-resolvase
MRFQILCQGVDMKVQSSPLLSRKEVAEKLKVSVRTVIRMEHRGLLNPVRLSRCIIRHTSDSIEGLLK